MTKTLLSLLTTLGLCAGTYSASAQVMPDYPIGLRNLSSGLCLDIANNDQRPGGVLIQWDCHSRPNQQWMLYPSGRGYQIVNQNSGLCLDVKGEQRGNGAEVIQWTCHGKANQQWYMTPSPTGLIIRNVNSNRCLDVPASSRRGGERLIQWDCNGGANQSFQSEAG